VLPIKEAFAVINDVQSRLTPNGRAFFTVRRDLKRPKPPQSNVRLHLSMEYEKPGRFAIYTIYGTWK
jgi:hypothetical protein